MFCFQCEQTAKGTGCTRHGVCGKDPTTATLQDLLLHATKGLAMYAHRARALGAKDRELDIFVVEALFTTVTNVNFDAERIAQWVRRAAALRDKAKALYESACKKAGKTPAQHPAEEKLGGPASPGRSPATPGQSPAAFQPAGDLAGLVAQGHEVGILARKRVLGEEATALESLVTFGLKGAAAYADHAQILGQADDGVYAFFHDTLDLLAREKPTADELLARALAVGEVNLKIMGLLDAANTGAYGNPEPTPVRITPKKGKAIVVSGHDLKDLEELLKQTEGTGINVYTHGEMLPAHGYPGLKKYPHLAGNYGGAWQDQQEEFDTFPGAILMTTNCIQKPRDSYIGRIFTSGLVAWPGVRHIGDRNFKPLIDAALAAPGFAEDAPEKTILVGFGHAAVLGVAEKVIAAVKAGKIRRFFLIGGCDGAKPGRNYYTELAEAVPEDCVILTLACGKYRFNKLAFGDIGGIPRLLDCGQCNDAYSAIQIAGALAEAFGCGVNDLPLSLILSWYEQKAVVILLTLLHLGIRNIRLGPSLPAFVTPAMLKVLAEKFNIMPISTPKEDLEAALAGK
ncbi:MAG TPA: hydroxylamine reductase [Phycisphaerae bacterium]|nr:hydroxylamine reductase [Phycisphaerae bacterium]